MLHEMAILIIKITNTKPHLLESFEKWKMDPGF